MSYDAYCGEHRLRQQRITFEQLQAIVEAMNLFTVTHDILLWPLISGMETNVVPEDVEAHIYSFLNFTTNKEDFFHNLMRMKDAALKKILSFRTDRRTWRDYYEIVDNVFGLQLLE